MKVVLDKFICTVLREPGDARVNDESHLLHRVKLELIKQGHKVIKKRMWKDGHLTADSQYYVRTRKRSGEGVFCIYDPNYQLRDIAEQYRKDGVVIYRRESL